jgi:hypothetical protein
MFSLGVVDFNEAMMMNDDEDFSSSTSSVEDFDREDSPTNKRYSAIVNDLQQAISMVESSFERQHNGDEEDDSDDVDESDTSSINAEMRHLESVQDLKLELEQADHNFHQEVENSNMDDDDDEDNDNDPNTNPWWPSSPIENEKRGSITQLHRKNSSNGSNTSETSLVDPFRWEEEDLDDATEPPPIPFLELILQHYRSMQHQNQQLHLQRVAQEPFHQWMDWRFIVNLATLQIHTLNIATTATRRMITLRHPSWWNPLSVWFREILTLPSKEDTIHLYRLAIVMGSLDVSRRHQSRWHVILLNDAIGRAMRQKSSSLHLARTHHGMNS